MRVPDWFCKELSFIDPRYFVVFNEEYRYYEVKVRMNFSRKVEIPGSVTSDGRNRVIMKGVSLKMRIKDPTVAVFDHPIDSILDDLRRRRRIAANRPGGEDAELREIIARNKKAKKKKIELGQEQMAEGFIEDYKYNRRHTVS
jgi:hypothetical protein